MLGAVIRFNETMALVSAKRLNNAGKSWILLNSFASEMKFKGGVKIPNSRRLTKVIYYSENVLLRGLGFERY
jgi:hypothetical protein